MTGSAGAPSPSPPVRLRETAPPLVSRRGWRIAGGWSFGVLLALDLGVLLIVLSLAQVTADGPAQRSLRHSVAILTEVDAFLDDRYDALRDDAARRRPEDSFTVPDFPVPVTVTAEEIQTTDRAQFRAVLLTRAVERVHDDGVAVFHEGRDEDISVLSMEGVLRAGLNFLRPAPHRVLTMLTIAFAALAGLLAAGLVATTRAYGRVWALGLAFVASALPVLVGAIGGRYIFRFAADAQDDYLIHELLTLGQELAWAPIRNSIIFAGMGAIVVIVGFALTRWDAHRSRYA